MNTKVRKFLQYMVPKLLALGRSERKNVAAEYKIGTEGTEYSTAQKKYLLDIHS